MSTAAVTAPQWYRDPVSCLQSTFATVLLSAGHDPLEVLGSPLEFRYIPGDVRSEEFYFPCRVPGDPGASLAPFHPMSARWKRPADPSDPLGPIRRAAERGVPTIAAVDNYHLPFRPAYQDVHAAHLVVVTGWDQAEDLVHVSDAMPPAFSGTVSTQAFLAAWNSANRTDGHEDLFSDRSIDGRHLHVELGSPFPVLTRDMLRGILRTNVERLTGTDSGPGRTGLAGVRRFTDDLTARARDGDTDGLAEAYPFGWNLQAQASIHGELLRSRGVLWNAPRLREAGRVAESVAHAWTGVRVTAAHGRTSPRECARDLRHHGDVLVRRYEEAADALGLAAEAL